MGDEASPIRLVVNADGFATSPPFSRAILRAHHEGIVTSTSVIGNCADPGAVKALLEGAPRLGVGVHLTLIGGLPVCSPAAVRSLVDDQGAFPERPAQLAVAWASARMRADDVEREFDAQVTRLRDAGLAIDHLSTHHHSGFLPTVGRAVETVARKHGIPGIRMAVERPSLGWLMELPRGVVAATLGGLAWLTRRQMGALRHGPQTWGFVESGRLDEIRILEIIGRLGPGQHELICHPSETEDGELRALTSPLLRQALERRRISLCRWQDLF